jgi:PASTA domain
MSHLRIVRVLGTLFAVALTLTLSAAGSLPVGAAGTASTPNAGARSLPAGASACRSTQAKPSSPVAACGTTAAAASRSAATVSLPAGTTACASTVTKPSSGAAACATTHAPAQAASPITFALKLVAGPVSLGPGGTTTLTAISDHDVSPTPFFIEIFDATAGAFLASCGAGTTCATSVTQSGSTVRNYTAYVTDSGKTFPPPAPQATSNTVTVSWLGIGLTASPSALQPGGTTTLTATATVDVSSTPFFIEIFDAVTGALVVECGFGATCASSVTQSGSTVRTYVAYVSDLSTAFPPPDIRGQSTAALVSWISVSLSISPTSLPTGSAASLTATASLDVGPTPFFIEVFDVTNGTLATGCGAGAVCAASVTQSSPGLHSYTAFVSNFATFPPPSDIRATSNTVDVNWTAVPVTVPDVIGDTESGASQALQAVGLVLGAESSNGCFDETHIYTQSPSAGTQVPAGSAVSIGFGTPPVPPRVCP